MSKDNGGPALPPVHNPETHPSGMTLRDYFAAKALQGLLADLPKALWGMGWKDNVAGTSYEIADAMLEARKK